MMRSNRDWHPRGSPQDLTFSSYRSLEDDFYQKEQMYKSERPPRPLYQRHDMKPKRRDYGEYHRGPRHPETSEEPPRRSEDKRPSSPGRSRSKRTSKRHTAAERQEREHTTESTVSSTVSPRKVEDRVTVRVNDEFNRTGGAGQMVGLYRVFIE